MMRFRLSLWRSALHQGTAMRWSSYLNIGDVKLPLSLSASSEPERVPRSLPDMCKRVLPLTSDVRAAIRWMAQKELLQQDVCIVGDPGPMRRWLALTYCHYARREVQMLCLTRDTTDGDIKQRKEILNGTLKYAHQAAVRAALNGQVLILEGLERAERNVLPILNNLLENREMHLDDGRSIIHPRRYDALLRHNTKEELDRMGLLRCSEHFRVIGLTVSVPKFHGNPLDPPLRSRFQSYFMHPQLDCANGLLSSKGAVGSSIAQLRASLIASDIGGSDTDRRLQVPSLGAVEALALLDLATQFPKESPAELLPMVYPFEHLCGVGGSASADALARRSHVDSLLQRYQLKATPQGGDAMASSVLTKLMPSAAGSGEPSTLGRRFATASFATGESLKIPVGECFGDGQCATQHFATIVASHAPTTARNHLPASRHVAVTPYHHNLLNRMVMSHACRRHMLLLGEAGCGKSCMVHRFADMLGYATEVLHMYADMSVRDLLQRRVTAPSTGDTRWELSPLMLAALHGRVAVLDGVDTLPSGLLSVLQELLVDGNITLMDGTLFLSQENYDALLAAGATPATLAARNVHCVHPAFRVIATAKPPRSVKGTSSTTKGGQSSSWLTTDVTAMFNVIAFGDVPEESVTMVVEHTARTAADSAAASSPAVLEKRIRAAKKLVQLKRTLAAMLVSDPKIPQLTLRQVIQIATHNSATAEELVDATESALLMPLVATVTRVQLQEILQKCAVCREPPTSTPLSRVLHGSAAAAAAGRKSDPSLNVAQVTFSCDPITGFVSVLDQNGNVMYANTRKYSLSERSMVPHVQNFVPNAQQSAVLSWIAKRFSSSSRILLVGTQGVGKNKVIDYFLMRAGLPRHYIQLHRDTTVGSLTTTPTVAAGKVIWEDSPLVKAVKFGHVLVIDEIDKAPVEVVQVLKGLVEDREMYLSDGRRILSPEAAAAREARVARGDVVVDNEATVVVHADFRVLVLANPPGYPFHGNDFYRVCGDLFQTLVLRNPDAASQFTLLSALCPKVPRAILQQLIDVFEKLTKLCQDGVLVYPFSLRELIAVVRHLESFPQDGVFQALNNVFNFDVTDENTMNHVRRILHQSLKKDVVRHLQNKIPVPHVLEKSERITLDKSPIDPERTLGVPCAVTPIQSLDDFPSRRIARLTNVTWTSYAPEQLGLALPTDFSDVLFTLHPTFFRNGSVSGARLLSMASSRYGVLALLHTNDEVRQRNTVLLTVVTPPVTSARFGAGALFAGAPPGVAVSCEVALTAFSPLTEVSDLVVALLDADFPTHDDDNGEQSLKGSRPTVVVLDHATGLLLVVDPRSLTASEPNTAAAATESTDWNDTSDVAAEVEVLAQQQQEPPQSDLRPTSATAPILSMTAPPHALPLCKGASCISDEFGFVTTCLANSNALHILQVGVDGSLVWWNVPLPGVVVQLTWFDECTAHLVLRSPGSSREAAVDHGILTLEDEHRTCTFAFLNAETVERLALNEDGARIVGRAQVPQGNSAPAGFSAVIARPKSHCYATVTGQQAVVLSLDAAASSDCRTPQPPTFDSSTKQLIMNSVVVNIMEGTGRAWSVAGSSHLAHSRGVSYALSSNGAELRAVDRDYNRLESEFSAWKSLFDGGDASAVGAPPTPKELDMWYSEPRKKPSGTLKHGKEDPENTPHVGGNTWAGGTGGTDTAGLGGLVGPYRLDKGHTVHQVDPEQKRAVPPHIVEEARRMGKEALQKRLQEIGMTAEEHRMYSDVLDRVRGPMTQLQTMMNSLKAQEGERTWARHQSEGVWDDAKVVEGITGERNIFKRRVDSTDPDRLQHRKKKRLLFVLDVSASMYRFNGADHRLNRLVECATMIMEALVGQEDKINYSFVGHNGDDDHLPLVEFGKPPQNKKERMSVCMRMIAYAQYCWSGDNTVNAMRKSIETVTKEDADSYFVFVISDANLRQYGISPLELARIIRSDDRVHMFCIFIASFGQQSSQLQSHLPTGHGFECFDTSQLPLVMNKIFVATNVLGV